jgi:agmatinase
MKLPWITDTAELAARRPDVAIIGAPFDDAVSHRSGARFGPRAIRQAQYTSGSINSLQVDIEPFEVLDVVDAGDANIVPAWIDRAHALIYRKVREVAATGAIPIVLGGDHSITWPSATAVAEIRRPGSIGIVHFDAHADTANDDWGVLAGHGTPMRRLIESGAVAGRNFVQVGLRGYWPPVETFEWMQQQGLRYHFMREIEERGAEAVIAQAIDEALDGPDAIYLSLDIDVIDPGLAPGTGTPEPGGMLTREVLRAIRQIVGRVELAAMDVVEVSPPYDHAETTAKAAHRAAQEAISALAVKRAAGRTVRWEGTAG